MTHPRLRKRSPMTPEARAALGERTRKAWAGLTPEQRTARGHLAHRSALDTRADPQMEPVRIGPEFRALLAQACTRWREHGASSATIEALAVAIVVEGPSLERSLMLLAQDVEAGDTDHQTFGNLAAIADRLVSQYDHLGDPARVCDHLALMVGLDPVVGIVLPPAPGAPEWVQ